MLSTSMKILKGVTTPCPSPTLFLGTGTRAMAWRRCRCVYVCDWGAGVPCSCIN